MCQAQVGFWGHNIQWLLQKATVEAKVAEWFFSTQKNSKYLFSQMPRCLSRFFFGMCGADKNPVNSICLQCTGSEPGPQNWKFVRLSWPDLRLSIDKISSKESLRARDGDFMPKSQHRQAEAGGFLGIQGQSKIHSELKPRPHSRPSLRTTKHKVG